MNDIIAFDDKEKRLVMRTTIEQYEIALAKALDENGGNQMDKINDEGLTEYFVDGAYIRQLLIPKDTTIVSRLWTQERLWVIISGDVTVTSELGRHRYIAPYIGMAPFGTKVALYAHEDTLWLAITGAKSTNSEDVKLEVTTENYNAITYPWDKLEYKGDNQ